MVNSIYLYYITYKIFFQGDIIKMYIKGFQKTTLLDFPCKVACTVFTGGCNFRCPFCHNATLVLENAKENTTPEEEFFAFLSKRKGILDGVCITGGEPLLQKDIVPFIQRIKDLGFAVKLDTNGAFPEKLKEIISLGIVDHVAMDIKNSKEKYAYTCGLEKFPDGVAESIKLLLRGQVPYEFRTTVVHELHSVEDIIGIGEMIKGADRYYLQCFKDSGDILEDGLSAPSEEELRSMCQAAAPFVGTCEIRGI